MGLAITDDHAELAATVRRWAEARGLLAEARARSRRRRGSRGHEDDTLPAWWGEVAEMGWLGLAVGPSTEARVMAWPSWRWCSRSWGAGVRPARCCRR